MRPTAYAQAIVVARAIKSRLLKSDVIREAALAKDLGEALIALRESLYPGIGEAKTLTQALTSIWTGYFKTIEHLARVTPGEALDVVLAPLREEDLRDLLIIIYRAVAGKPVDEKLPSAFYDKTLTYNVLRDPELLASPQKILEFTEGTWAYSYVEDSLKLARELKGLPALWSIPLIVVRLYHDSIEKLGLNDVRSLEKLLCPHLEYKILSSLTVAKQFDVPLKLIEIAVGDMSEVCGGSVEELKSIYEREADAVSVANELKGILRNIRIEGKSVNEILVNALRSSRQVLKARAITAMSGYPFNPAFLAASVILLKIEVETLSYIVSSKEYRVSPADLLELLGLEAM